MHYEQNELAAKLADKIGDGIQVVPWRMPHTLARHDREGRIIQKGKPKNNFAHTERILRDIGRKNGPQTQHQEATKYDRRNETLTQTRQGNTERAAREATGYLRGLHGTILGNSIAKSFKDQSKANLLGQ